MPRQLNAHSNFVFLKKIELEFQKIEDEIIKCNKCRVCFACHRAEYNDFEKERKCFYTSNSNVDSRKIRFQGRFHRLLSSNLWGYLGRFGSKFPNF